MERKNVNILLYVINKTEEIVYKNLNGTLILFVRHGECEGNIKGLFRGRTDFPLNQRGHAQVEDLGHELKNYLIQNIYSSPLARARQTAEAIAKQCNVKIKIEKNLNNIELGNWEGLKKIRIAEQYPKEWNMWINTPETLEIDGMETLGNVQKRAKKCLDHLVKENRGKTFAIVSHRAVLKPLIAACLNMNSPYFWKIHLDTASYSLLSYNEDKGYCLIQHNQNKHLKEFVSEWA